MSHTQQIEFCKLVKKKFPEKFSGVSVLDVGSLDINGSNRYLFKEFEYTGVDIADGNNVDLVQLIHTVCGMELYDVVICTEMLEHDQFYVHSIKAMHRLLKHDGLLIITCATDGRPEHGTYEKEPDSSPFTNEYYKNISRKMFFDVIEKLDFKDTHFLQDFNIGDLYFWGIKS